MDDTTRLFYNANGQLASIVDPGGAQVRFGYDAGILTRIWDALVNDWIAADPAHRTTTDTIATVFSYDAQGKLSAATLPAPDGTTEALRPRKEYTYLSGTTYVDIDGLDINKIDLTGEMTADTYLANLKWNASIQHRTRGRIVKKVAWVPAYGTGADLSSEIQMKRQATGASEALGYVSLGAAGMSILFATASYLAPAHPYVKAGLYAVSMVFGALGSAAGITSLTLECLAFNFDAMCQGKMYPAAVGLAFTFIAPGPLPAAIFAFQTGVPWLLAQRKQQT